MARSLSPLIPFIHAALKVVAREKNGATKVVARNSSAERVAIGGKVTVPVVPTMAARDTQVSMNQDDGENGDVGAIEMAITKSRSVSIYLTGEESLTLQSGGTFSDVRSQSITQAIRTLANEIEIDVTSEAVKNATRIIQYSSAGVLKDAVLDSAFARKALVDAGSPLVDMKLVTNSLGGAHILSNTNLSRANEAGTDAGLRRGDLLPINGFYPTESGFLNQGANGDAVANTTTAGFAIGSKEIAVSVTSGAFVVGDVISFAGDSNLYNIAAVEAAKITLTDGIRVAIPAAATAITTVAKKDPTIFFPSQALVLLCRAPAIPNGGDLAVDRYTIVDPESGITFEAALYLGRKKNEIEISAAWGVKAVNKEFLGLMV